jgi:guanosine-3',5'-bis(diphosphate) 3'-pyrophosphohydrolase
LGNHAVGAKVDGEIRPLSTPLTSGQVVDVITDVLATPNPDWLSFINTQKARRALQNILRDQDIEEQRLVGQQALNRALNCLIDPSMIYLNRTGWMCCNGVMLKIKIHYLNKLQWVIFYRNWSPIIYCTAGHSSS